jgi:carboxypeptidase PM20D1
LLASHLDVVPVDPSAWEVPPFGGKIVNRTYIYGRGAIDDKSGVLGIMEAVEYVIQKGHRPQRTFFMAFGHDEEISGKRGAQELAKALKSRGVDRLDFVLDEGFPLTKNLIPGTDKPIAMVGISEKGTATLELSVSGTPGHSSFPPPESAIGILAAAIARLEENPQPSLLGQGPDSATFKYLAPHVSFFYRLLYNNMWLFSGLMARQMERVPVTNAFVRTTTAITLFHGGIKDNVVPPSAKAVINHRVHPSQRVAEVIAYDREIISDPRVNIRVKASKEAHPISPFGPDCIPFQMVAVSIKQVFTDAVVVPAVFIANTDTRWYLSFTKNLYRFLPTVVMQEDVSRYHGNNERISIQHYHQAVNFYYRIIKNADMLTDQVPASTMNNGDEEL